MPFPTVRRRFAGQAMLAATVAALLLPAACSSPPPPPPPTVVNLKLTTSADVNPTQSGQGAPVVVRVYQLSSPAGFEKAEFFRLLNQDAATLGSDVVKKDEYLLPPDTSKTVTLNPGATVKSLGVFAAFREFHDVTWRGTADVPANKTTDVTVTADGKGVTVAAKPGS
ncbi:MAG: type VI secretion system lipoprotein TssJ [Acetobacteraceae bacterium]|nr:type VI secretion system lipoprotein TssJ [Acetobacteraceae bacterium]